jgi:hypothetical protein
MGVGSTGMVTVDCDDHARCGIVLLSRSRSRSRGGAGAGRLSVLVELRRALAHA